jgi:hypothetical protein
MVLTIKIYLFILFSWMDEWRLEAYELFNSIKLIITEEMIGEVTSEKELQKQK